MHSICVILLCLWVIDWIESWFRFAKTPIHWTLWTHFWRGSSWWSKDDECVTLLLQEHIDNEEYHLMFSWLWIDLPSLVSFKGSVFNYYYFGIVVLESSHLVIDWTRYPSIIIRWNTIRLWILRVHLFPPILRYAFSHLIIIRCYWSRISHQKQKQVCLILIPFVSLNPIHIDNHESLNTQFTNLIESFITINNLISLFTPITQPTNPWFW